MVEEGAKSPHEEAGSLALLGTLWGTVVTEHALELVRRTLTLLVEDPQERKRLARC